MLFVIIYAIELCVCPFNPRQPTESALSQGDCLSSMLLAHENQPKSIPL